MKLDYGWKSPEDFRRWGPFLSFGTHASSEIRICWQSQFHSLSKWIKYGETEECSIKIEEDVEPSCFHFFILKDLKPNTKYYYKISRSEDLIQKEQPIYSFKTAPPEGTKVEFDFCVAGDMHATDANILPTLKSMVLNVPDNRFFCTVGDCVTHGGHETAWNNFFWQISHYDPSVPLMNTTGNHDSDHPESYAHFVQTFRHPYIDRKKGAFYYFIYANAVFIMLDSDNAGQTQAVQGVISDDQMEWLEELLEEYAKKDYWIFIFMHHQIYSTGDFGMVHLYDMAYRWLFDEYQVDAVFYGHDHQFEVYWRSKDTEWGGTHYCLVGNGGGGLNDFIRDAKRKPHLPNYLWVGRTYIPDRDGILGGNPDGSRMDDVIESSLQYGIMEHGFTHLHINGDSCEMKMWGLQNQIYFKDVFKQTGKGKKYQKPEFVQEF